MQFISELEDLINRYSIENDSNTPDFILANYINKCLINFADTVNARDCWYSKNPKFGEFQSKNSTITPPDLSFFGNRCK